MSSWQVGDVAIFLYSQARPEFVGHEVTVLSELRPANTPAGDSIRKGELVYAIDIPVDDPRLKHSVCLPDQLGRLPDGNQASTWDEMQDIWVPGELVSYEHEV